ncbi:LAME_0E04390g1_1 [Lachancea meyersii CBS 8951]|uniref:Nuclear pore complex protein n=1 Tax=Lachancea meyersii CBS 8951 TaxID=1266667 RepID=A0A1G4JH38_9SACH|nr:LAME_0E04390g1_1 [Lachancea meyersii CBS 8951]
MEIDSGRNISVLVEFANVLKEFKITELNSPGSKNFFDVVREFRSVAGEAALKLVSGDIASSGGVFENWDLEAKLWHLIELLVDYRTADVDLEQEGQSSADSIYHKVRMEDNSPLYELWLIIVWIQSNVKVPERPDSLGTSKWSNSFISGELKSCDSDYPLRDPKCVLDPEDIQSDQSFYKYAYELIQAGKMDEARKECEHTDNLTLALILCGVDNQVELDTESPHTLESYKQKTLWRRAVHSLSKNEKLDAYERAIYSYLAGDIGQTTENIETSWDTELLLYLNQSWQTALENHMVKENLVNTKEMIVPMEIQSIPLQSALDIVSKNHPRASEHPLRVLMGAVMLDKVPSVIKSSVAMLVDAIKGLDPSNVMVEEPYLLRVVTHLVIMMDIVYPGSIEEQDKSKLITAYVTILSFYELNDIIPVYISFLSEPDALEAYSFLLSNLTETDARKKQLELCRLLHLPVANILRRTAQRVFDETENSYCPRARVNVQSPINATDKRLIAAAEWLIEGHISVDALNSLVVISRRFLLNGRINSLRYLYEKQNLDNLIKNYEIDTLTDTENTSTAAKEIGDYRSLIQAFKKFEQWQEMSRGEQSDTNLSSLLTSFRNISSFVHKVIKSFLMDLSDKSTPEDQDTIYEIRALYTPHMVIELHRAFVVASEKLRVASFVTEALSLANLVANETDRIYLLFQSCGRLEEYLQLIARTATMIKP